MEKTGHIPLTREFVDLMESDGNLKSMMIESIRKAADINPDPETNPCLSLDSMYDFMDWLGSCLPWTVLKDKKYPTLYRHIDQGVDYFWFVFDQPLDELKNKGYYFPSLQYYPPISGWLQHYAASWGAFLSQPCSWTPEYEKLFLEDEKFGLCKGWYESSSNWHSFNDFFSRKLSSPSMRPIASASVVSPADSYPQGFWNIDDNGNVVHDRPVSLKSAKLSSVSDLIGRDSTYCDVFKGGSLTHTLLDVHDYHRYHAPVDGKVVEMRKIPGVNAAGGVTVWDKSTGHYVLESEMGFEMIETRDCIIFETPEMGYVAMLPVGMSQICSCNWEPTLKVGSEVRKGDNIGYFLFGGSDIVLIFQRGFKMKLLPPFDHHTLMGEPYADILCE